MKANLLSGFLLSGVLFLNARAQTLYVPSGTSGIGANTSGNTNIGIGTTNAPADKLHVKSGMIRLEGTNSVSALAANALRIGNNGATNSWIQSNSTATGNTSALLINPLGGKVGIGVNGVPAENLHVGNNVQIDGLLHMSPTLELSNAGLAFNMQWNGSNLVKPLANIPAGQWFYHYSAGSNTGIGDLVYRTVTASTSNNAVVQASEWGTPFVIKATTGNVGINTLLPLAKLHVNGQVVIGSLNQAQVSAGSSYKLLVADGIMTPKVKVAVAGTSDWSDYVFADDYKLKTLLEVEQFVKANKHLPGVPSAQEVVEKGIDLGKMDSKLLEKIEELTLYLIELQKQNDKLAHEVAQLRK